MDMKILNNILYSLIFCFSFTTLSAQERTNKQPIKFDNKSKKLTNAVGWRLNDENGIWVSNKNVIDKNICPPFWVSRIYQNFNWLQFATIFIGSQKYYILLLEKLGGAYKYPNIKQDWETNHEIHFFVIDTNDYVNLKNNIYLKSGNNFTITSRKHGYITDRYEILGSEHLYIEENLLVKIANSFEKSTFREFCFVVNSQIVKENEVVRFIIPESCVYLQLSENGILQSSYFEVDLVDIKSILID